MQSTNGNVVKLKLLCYNRDKHQSVGVCCTKQSWESNTPRPNSLGNETFYSLVYENKPFLNLLIIYILGWLIVTASHDDNRFFPYIDSWDLIRNHMTLSTRRRHLFKVRPHISTFKLFILEKFENVIVIVVFFIVIQLSCLFSMWFRRKSFFSKSYQLPHLNDICGCGFIAKAILTIFSLDEIQVFKMSAWS